MSNTGRRGTLAPIIKHAGGTWDWAVPQIALDAYDAVSLPGDVYQGKIDPMSEEGMRRAFGLATMIVPASRAGSVTAEGMASRSTRIYNPPSKTPRPIEADYPRGVPVDDAGRITHDIEGRLLVADHIAGRRQVGGVLGGRDQALSPEAGDYVSITERSIGSVPEARPSRALPRGSVGAYQEYRGVDGPERSIGVLNTLDEASTAKVTAHEMGHMIDELSGQIPIDGLNTELRQVYNTLNTGQERTRHLTGPQHVGYSGDAVPRELMVEAVRAYMADPNYLKTVAPKTAARIREYVNNNPRLRDTIQFNSVAPIVAGGAAAGAILAPSEAKGQGTMTPEQQKALALARARRARASASGGASATPSAAAGQHGAADAAAAGFLDTMTFGTIDELGAGLAYGINQLPGGDGASYSDILAKTRGEIGQAQTDNPGSYLGGQIVGGIGGGLGMARTGLSMGANAVRAGAGLGKVAGASAVDGMLMGAASGAGSGEGIEGRISGSLVGGGLGAGMGAAAPLAVAGVSAAAKPLIAPFAARAFPESYANAAIGDGMQRAGISPDEIAQRLSAAASDGQPMFNVADAMGNSGQRMLSTVARTPNDARQGVVDTLAQRQMGQSERLAATLADGFDSADTAAARTRTLTDARTTEANQLYGKARASAGAVNVTPVLQEIDATLSPGVSGLARPGDRLAPDSIEGALARVRSMISDGKSNLTDFNALFRAKLDLDDMIARSDAQGAGNRAHALSRVQRLVDDALAKASPDYAAARDAFSTASRRIDAVGEGSAAASGRKRAADNIDRFGQMTPEEQSAFRAGYADPLIARVEGASISPTTNKARLLMTEKTGQEFPEFAALGRADQMGTRIAREDRMFQTANAALGGSKTADNLADAAEMSRFDPGVMTALFQGRPMQAAMSAVARALNEGKGLTPPVLSRVAKAMMETNPDFARKVLEAAQAKVAGNTAAKSKATAILSALGASAAGRLASP